MLKLDHPDLNSSKKDKDVRVHKNCIAFRVRALLPARYSVRPRHGVVAPGESVSITIILIEREKEVLLDSFKKATSTCTLNDNGNGNGNGNSVSTSTTVPTDNKRDEFLLQTFTIKQKETRSRLGPKTQFQPEEKREVVQKGIAIGGKKKTCLSKEESRELSKIWNVVNSIVGVPIQNKKIKVRHVVDRVILEADDRAKKEQGETIITRTSSTDKEHYSQLKHMTPDQLIEEIHSLCRQNDELITFNSKLVAEMDALRKTSKISPNEVDRE